MQGAYRQESVGGCKAGVEVWAILVIPRLHRIAKEKTGDSPFLLLALFIRLVTVVTSEAPNIIETEGT